jgi:hypothetical protein
VSGQIASFAPGMLLSLNRIAWIGLSTQAGLTRLFLEYTPDLLRLISPLVITVGNEPSATEITPFGDSAE